MKNLLYLSLLVFVVSCQFPRTSDSKDFSQNLLYKTWVLQDENGDVVSYNGQVINLQLMEDNSYRASGFAGCNRYFSSVELSEESIQFHQIGATLMACPEMDAEQMFLDLLPKINRYEINGKNLKMYQGKILLFHFISK